MQIPRYLYMNTKLNTSRREKHEHGRLEHIIS